MPLENYPPGELEPRDLNSPEIENPYQVIHEFFDYGHLPEIRIQLWELLTTTVCSNFHKQTQRERAGMIYFFGKLRKLIEAIHLIHREQLRKNVNAKSQEE